MNVTSENLNFDLVELTNSIPTELGQCRKVRNLSLANTQISGTLPSELGNLRQLTNLTLTNSPKLKGTLPIEISHLPSLKILDLSSTQITISIHSTVLLCNRSEPVKTIVDAWDHECSCCING
jgi:hypothetical protein